MALKPILPSPSILYSILTCPYCLTFITGWCPYCKDVVAAARSGWKEAGQDGSNSQARG